MFLSFFLLSASQEAPASLASSVSDPAKVGRFVTFCTQILDYVDSDLARQGFSTAGATGAFFTQFLPSLLVDARFGQMPYWVDECSWLGDAGRGWVWWGRVQGLFWCGRCVCSKLVQVDDSAAFQLMEPLSRVATRLDSLTADTLATACDSERVLVETAHPYPAPVVQTWDLDFPGVCVYVGC